MCSGPDPPFALAGLLFALDGLLFALDGIPLALDGIPLALLPAVLPVLFGCLLPAFFAPQERSRPGRIGARFPYAYFELAGFIFWKLKMKFETNQNAGVEMKNTPPPLQIFGELWPMLTARRAAPSVSSHQRLNITPDSDTGDTKSFGDPLFVVGLELSRGDQFQHLQPALLHQPAAFVMIAPPAGQKMVELFLVSELWQITHLELLAPRVTFSPYLTQVLGRLKCDIGTIESLSIGNSLDKSNVMRIIVGAGLKGFDRQREIEGASENLNDLAGRGFESHQLHWTGN